MPGIATAIQMMGNSSTANALFLIAILITETNPAVKQAVRGGPASTHPKKILTVTGQPGKGDGRIQSSLTMSLCSQEEVVLLVRITNLAQLLAALNQTEILREDLITRVLPEDLVMNLSQKDPIMRDLKGVLMTAIRSEITSF